MSGWGNPLSVAAVGSLALTEGVKLLCTQAGELLKRWRGRDPGCDAESEVEVELCDKLPREAFIGEFRPVRPDPQTLSTVVVPMQELREAVADYAQGIDPLAPR